MGITFSIPPAFYPTEAEDRGIGASQYGFVFGISNLAAAVFSIVFAIYGKK